MVATVRAARSSDKKPLMEFISRNWGGHDYIPRVWDDWLRDRRAKTLVVEVDGRPVGMSRVNFLEDGSAWFEGARVHPAFRGRGLATMLGNKAIRIAAQEGVNALRLMSNSRNRAARRQVAKIGFAELSRISVYIPVKSSRFRPRQGVRRAVGEDIAGLARSMLSSREFKVGGGVYWDGFRAISLTPETIRKRVLEGSVYLYGDAIAVSKFDSEGGERWRQVCFACGGSDDVRKLISHIFSKGGGEGMLGRFVCAPQRSPLVSAAREAGLVRWSSFILFGRRLPNG